MEVKEKKYQYKKETDTKSVKILKDVHKELKIRVANTGENITEFVSNAIRHALSKPIKSNQ